MVEIYQILFLNFLRDCVSISLTNDMADQDDYLGSEILTTLLLPLAVVFENINVIWKKQWTTKHRKLWYGGTNQLYILHDKGANMIKITLVDNDKVISDNVKLCKIFSNFFQDMVKDLLLVTVLIFLIILIAIL